MHAQTQESLEGKTNRFTETAEADSAEKCPKTPLQLKTSLLEMHLA